MLDLKLVLCENKSLASAITSNTLDLVQDKPDTGTYPMFIVMLFPTAGTGAGSTNAVTFKIQDSADGTTDWKDVALTPAIAGQDCKGSMVMPMPMKHRRYIRLVSTVAGTVTGNVTAYMSDQYPIEVDYKMQGYEWTEPEPDSGD